MNSFQALVAVALAWPGAPIVLAQEGQWAHERFQYSAVDCKRHLGTPRRFTGSPQFDRMTPQQVLAECEGMARELAADLSNPAIPLSDKTKTLERLRTLGRAARPAVPAIIAALDDHRSRGRDEDVSSFCRGAEALGEADPRSPAVIQALTDSLARDSRGVSTCLRCACALKALALAGPDAARIAGPVLEKLAARRPPLKLGALSPAQLGKTIEAVGLRPGTADALLGSVAPPGPLGTGPSLAERVAALRALAQNVEQLEPAYRIVLAQTAASQLKEAHPPLRVAAAEALGRLGQIELLEPALLDPHYEVRRAALGGLAQSGPRASRYFGPAVDALDPLLGTTEAAAKALVAMGPGIAFEVELRTAGARLDLQPLHQAVVRAIKKGDLRPIQEALDKSFAKGPHGRGFVRLDVLGEGSGPAYLFGVHRIQVDFRGGVYGPGREKAAPIEGALTLEPTTTNNFLMAIAGSPKGRRLRLVMSPEVAESPYFGTGQTDHWLPTGAAGEFEATIGKVCQPQIWEVFKGGGIFGPVRIETSCR